METKSKSSLRETVKKRKNDLLSSSAAKNAKNHKYLQNILWIA